MQADELRRELAEAKASLKEAEIELEDLEEELHQAQTALRELQGEQEVKQQRCAHHECLAHCSELASCTCVSIRCVLVHTSHAEGAAKYAAGSQQRLACGATMASISCSPLFTQQEPAAASWACPVCRCRLRKA